MLILLTKRLILNKPLLSPTPTFFFSKESISNSSKNPLYDTYRKFHNLPLDKLQIPGITMVRTPTDAERVIKILKTIKNRYITEQIPLLIKIIEIMPGILKQ